MKELICTVNAGIDAGGVIEMYRDENGLYWLKKHGDARTYLLSAAEVVKFLVWYYCRLSGGDYHKGSDNAIWQSVVYNLNYVIEEAAKENYNKKYTIMKERSKR